MTLAELTTHPAALPLAALAGIVIGAALSCPFAYLDGRRSAQEEQINAIAALRGKYITSSGLQPPAGAD